MDYLVQAGQFLLSLSILIVLHEFGHFIPARLFKTRVEKFYLFFNPWFSLFKFKKGETEWGLGWLPLGGYVKIAGMIDESMDKEQLSKPAEPWEFRSKPAWQRLIIMLGGVTVNFILGYFIYIMVLFVWGREFLPTENASYGMYVRNEVLRGEGLLQHGDILVGVDGKQPRTYQDAGKMILIDGARQIEVIRNGSTHLVTLPENIVDQLLESGKSSLFEPLFPFVIEKITSGGIGEQAGLKMNDSLVGITRDFKRPVFFPESVFPDSLFGLKRIDAPYFQTLAYQIQRSANQEITLHIYRDGVPMDVNAKLDEKGLLGIQPYRADRSLVFQTETFSFLESIPEGIKTGTETLSNYVKSLALLFSPAGAKQLGGFGSIGGMFPKEWDWQQFWLLTAFISIILAFMNLLPIPALDGGHVLFLLYEMVRGKAPNQRFLEIAQTVGMLLLLGLILYANLNDVLKLF
ncbi:MAG: M50 family metallopeptidase [Flavobacteriales bacterium]